MALATARIEVIPPRRATGELHAAYAALAEHAPRLGYIVRMYSLRPALVRLVGRYFTDVLGTGYLPRQDKEIVCVATSHAGRCAY
jgi:hypothetical protein